MNQEQLIPKTGIAKYRLIAGDEEHPAVEACTPRAELASVPVGYRGLGIRENGTLHSMIPCRF
jgi:hypothetical protein